MYRGLLEEISRHLTAISRSRPSLPVRLLLSKHLVRKGESFLDFGCGRGDDVRFLKKRGILARGFDPHFFPDTEVKAADVVNLGYVLNVIEDEKERTAVLRRAWGLTKGVLSVAARIGSDAKEGGVTSRNTFQKYYTQSELEEYLQKVLDHAAIEVTRGVFFVFREDRRKQDFTERKAMASLIDELREEVESTTTPSVGAYPVPVGEPLTQVPSERERKMLRRRERKHVPLSEGATSPSLFQLVRDEDETGVSGTGVVAEGAQFSNGKCVLCWTTGTSAVGVYDSLADVEKIHGHGGKTRIVKIES